MVSYINVFIDEYADKIVRFPSIVHGINDSAIQKRINVRTFFSVDDLVKTLTKEKRRVVIVISGSINHSEKLLLTLHRQKIHPIFFNLQVLNTSCPFSSVMPNMFSSFYKLTQTILLEWPEPSAFVGFNKDSTEDKIRLEAFKKAVEEQGVKEYVFSNDGDVDKCINHTISELPRLKNIFCTSDSVALLLMKKMKDKGIKPVDYNITGFANLKLSKHFKPSLTTIGENYYGVGVMAVEVFVFLYKRKQIHNLNLSMDYEIIFRESTHLGIKKEKEDKTLPTEVAPGEMVDFFGDEPINKIYNIENMLMKCDNKDFGILRDLLANKTYEEIAENHELVVNAVKYRLNKIENYLKVANRKELCACLNAYDLDI